MKTKTIGVREFRQNLTKIEHAISKGTSFVVTRHRKPIFEIRPPKKTMGQTLIEEFKPLQFSSGDPNLSKKIDDIVYGL